MQKKKILVTGADGFIGSHLCEHLVQNGHSVKAFCQYNSFGHNGWLDSASKEIKNEIEFYQGDIRDYSSVEEAAKGAEIIFHLASLIAIPYSYKAPQSYVDTNIHGTLNVVRAAREKAVEQVIHTSTSEVYGSAQYTPIDEKHPLVGQSPYSASKIGADQIALSYYLSFGLPVSIVRPFNTFGPRQSARAVIPTIITQLVAGASKLKLGNLESTRDFNYVKDTVSGMVSFMGNDRTYGEVINIGSSSEITIENLAKVIARVVEQEFEFEIDEQRLRPENSEVDRLLACNKKAFSILDWKPKYHGKEGFENAVKETVEWFSDKKNQGFYDPSKYTV